jgi:putative membrane protein
MNMAVAATYLAEGGGASVIAAVCLVAATLLYLYAWRAAVRTAPQQLPAWRVMSFLAGMAAFAISWSPQLIALTHHYLTAHMVQHLLSMLVAPPLILLGEPVLVFERGLRRPSRGPQSPAQVLVRERLRRAGLWLTHPVTAGSLMVAVTIFWHVPAVFQRSMSSPVWCALENLTFWLSGVIFWWPVVLPWPSKRQWPKWATPLYLLGSDMPVSILSAYLAFCGHVVYPMYRMAPRLSGPSALDDQVAAAMLMWVVMMVVFVAVSGAVLVSWLEPPAFKQPSSV